MSGRDFRGLDVVEDDSLLFDIFLKIERCSDNIDKLNRVVSSGKPLLIREDDWLYRFIRYVSPEKEFSNKLVIKKEEAIELLGELKDYCSSLLDSYSS